MVKYKKKKSKNQTTSDMAYIPGYNFISYHRINKSGGGVGLYLDKILIILIRSALRLFLLKLLSLGEKMS